DRIAAYAAQRRFEGYAPASVNQELQVIRRMFTLAIQAGKLTPAHRPHVARLAVENAREGFLEPATFATLRATLPDWLADAAAFAYLTGWRRGEIATLTWADVTLTATGGRVRLRAAHSKNKKTPYRAAHRRAARAPRTPKGTPAARLPARFPSRHRRAPRQLPQGVGLELRRRAAAWLTLPRPAALGGAQHGARWRPRACRDGALRASDAVGVRPLQHRERG